MATQSLPAAPLRQSSRRIALGMASSIIFGVSLGLLLAILAAIHFFGYAVLTVQSFSMEPSLERGDILVSQPTTTDDVKVGDIVVFETGERTRILVAHRVVGFVNVTMNIHNSQTGEDTQQLTRLLQTKGDANQTPDPNPVEPQNLKGKLLFSVPNAGLLFHDIPLQEALFGVAALTTLTWLLYELSRARSRRQRAN